MNPEKPESFTYDTDCGPCCGACPGENKGVLKRAGVRMMGKEMDLLRNCEVKQCTQRTPKVNEDTAGHVGIKQVENA